LEKRRNLYEAISKRALVYILVTVIGSALIVNYYLWAYYKDATSEIEDLKQRLDELEERVQASARYVKIGNITLQFDAFMPTKTVQGTTITYLMGFASVSNLTNIVVRPVTVEVLFEPNVTQIGDGTVTYDYTPSQVLEISSPELDRFDFPWGAFPVTLEGFRKGNEIEWDMKVTAIVLWMGNEVSRVSLDVQYRLIVGGSDAER